MEQTKQEQFIIRRIGGTTYKVRVAFSDIDDIVNLVKDKEKLDEMKEKCRELHRPDSAEKIFRLAQKLCNDSKGGNDK